MQQSQALEILKLGENVFLTGAAGAGKTFVLNQYIRYLRDHQVSVAITASTGIAATHINGQTIHSWCGMGVHESLSAQDLQKIALKDRVKKNVKKAQVLIIDEISMLHARQLDMINRICRAVRESSDPFGGLQVVLCGDFFQLPPVVKATNETKFAFESQSWQQGGFKVCYLSEQHRQRGDELLNILNEIRQGTAGEQTKVPLRSCYKRAIVDDAGKPVRPTLLYARNINVDTINGRELAKLPGDDHSFSMQASGFSAHVESLKRNCLAPEDLRLRVRAEVIFVKNAIDGQYVNGTRGIVESFDRDDGWPIVRLHKGGVVYASPAEWHYEENGIVRATITQLPLRLAWAITIHKSQGMTLEAAEIDLSDAFEPGMGYVALSRVRALSGLRLMGLNDVALKVHPAVLAFDGTLRTQSNSACTDLELLTAPELKIRRDYELYERFKGCAPSEVGGTAEPKGRLKRKRKRKNREQATIMPTHEITGSMLAQELSLLEIASSRQLALGTIITHLEKLKGLGKLPSINRLKNSIPASDFEKILNAFASSTDGKLKPIFEKFDGAHSFETLRTVRLFVEN